MSHMTHIHIAAAPAHSFIDDIFGECSVILFFLHTFYRLILGTMYSEYNCIFWKEKYFGIIIYLKYIYTINKVYLSALNFRITFLYYKLDV